MKRRSLLGAGFVVSAGGGAAHLIAGQSDALGLSAAGQGKPHDEPMPYTAKSGDTDIQFQSYIDSVPPGSTITIRVPPGDYSLNHDVQLNGRIVSYDIHENARFSGAGKLDIDQTNSSAFWGAQRLGTSAVRGSAKFPFNFRTPLAYYRKVHGSILATDGYGPNCTVMATMRKVAGDDIKTSNSVIFSETVDTVGNPHGGGDLSFVEALRGSAYGVAGATNLLLYGAVLGSGNEAGTSVKIMVGLETDIQNNYADAPTLDAYNPGGDPYLVSMNATVSGTKRALAYYSTNPGEWVAQSARPRVGYLHAGGTTEAAFASISYSKVGLDISRGTWSDRAISLPNASAIAAQNTARTGFINIAYAEKGTDNLVIGTNAPAVVIPTNGYIRGKLDVGGSGVFPVDDNAQDLGRSGNRFKNIYAANNVINRSDAKLKKVRGGLSDAELAAAKGIPIKVFQYLDAVTEKGAKARLHIGVIAQEVVAAFEAQNLDPWVYGVVGKDPEMKLVKKVRVISRPATEEYEEDFTEYVERGGVVVMERGKRTALRARTKELPVVDADGNPVVGMAPSTDERGIKKMVAKPATRIVPVMEEVEEEYFEDEPTGKDILSVRYEQLAMFMIAALRQL